jgi:serine O-acetyltransferase
MIDSKKAYKYYLEEDKKAYGIASDNLFFRLNPYIIDSVIWRFQKCMRTSEYYFNKKTNNPFIKLFKLFYAYRFKKLSIKMGFTIPVNCFGPGLRIMHRGNIVVNGNCKIGSNCTIHACVNIGTKTDNEINVPTLGNNVYIGPGVKIFGKITIADGCVIGANAVVNKSFINPNMVIAGIPAMERGLVKK